MSKMGPFLNLIGPQGLQADSIYEVNKRGGANSYSPSFCKLMLMLMVNSQTRWTAFQSPQS